jgi:hypothetical protein
MIIALGVIWTPAIPDYIKSLATTLLFILLLFAYVNGGFKKKKSNQS